MSDPLRPLDKQQPRRAEPLQPDKPGSGDSAQDDADFRKSRTGSTEQRSAERQREQSDTALENVRKGFD
jgi:hypothetical protein